MERSTSDVPASAGNQSLVYLIITRSLPLLSLQYLHSRCLQIYMSICPHTHTNKDLIITSCADTSQIIQSAVAGVGAATSCLEQPQLWRVHFVSKGCCYVIILCERCFYYATGNEEHDARTDRRLSNDVVYQMIMCATWKFQYTRSLNISVHTINDNELIWSKYCVSKSKTFL